MQIEQIYTGCLAQGAYYIESKGEVAIIDPLRETAPYLERAAKSNAKIKYVFETHFHADFVSGHLDLAHETGAVIVYGPTAVPGFAAKVAADNEVFILGDVKIKVLHTPGHTMESSCFLLIDENGKESAIFTGDTLFIGDVGRPDLAQKGAVTQEVLAGYLYDSLRNKIMILPDDLVIYPGHGAGSACGKNMSNEKRDILGHQKENNYALRADMTREEFVTEVLNGLMPPPAYFPNNAMMNKAGYDSFKDVIQRGLHSLNADNFQFTMQEREVLVLDTRDPKIFVEGFIPSSINIGIDGNFAPWVGTLIPDIKQEILIVADPGREQEVITRLARVGYDFAVGFLDGGFESWRNRGFEIDKIESISPLYFVSLYEKTPNILMLDVRKKSEFDTEHILGTVNGPLDCVNESMLKINKEEKTYVYCAGGYRSVIFISILKARGYQNLINVEGGFASLKETAQFELSEYSTPVSML